MNKIIVYLGLILTIAATTPTNVRLMIPENNHLFDSFSQFSSQPLFKHKRHMAFLPFHNDLDNNNTVTLSLFGSTDMGYYYTTLFVGNPPQRQTLIVDTGSSITTFPCKSIHISLLYIFTIDMFKKAVVIIVELHIIILNMTRRSLIQAHNHLVKKKLVHFHVKNVILNMKISVLSIL